jgi:hypothetical protein
MDRMWTTGEDFVGKEPLELASIVIKGEGITDTGLILL